MKKDLFERAKSASDARLAETARRQQSEIARRVRGTSSGVFHNPLPRWSNGKIVMPKEK